MRRVLPRAFRCFAVLGCLLSGVVVVAPPGGAAPARPAAVSATGGVFVPKSQRVLDTRGGVGAPAGALGSNATVSLQLAGGAVPASGVTAVRLNVTAVSPTAGTYLTVYPSGGTRPVASSLNVDAGQVLSNLVTVPLGADGKVAFYNHAGSVQVVADLVGYDTPDTTVGAGGHVFSSLAPTRVLDTRDGTGGHLGRVGPGGVVSLQVTGQNGVPTDELGSVLLTVTAVNPSAAGFVVAYPDGTSRPATSNLNFSAGQTVPILVLVKVGGDGRVDLYNANGTVDLVADLAGYGTITDAASSLAVGTNGALFDPLGPTRLLDTRTGAGTPVGANGTVSVAVAGQHGVPAGATAVALNVTATAATTATYVTAYPGGTNRPVASNLNVPAGATIANQVIVPVGADGSVTLYNHAGSVHLIADLAGYYSTGASSPWAVRDVPTPAAQPDGGQQVDPRGVACAGAAGCVATSDTEVGSGPKGVLVTVTGAGVTSVAPPLPAGVTDPDVVNVTKPICPSTGVCLVLGNYDRVSDSTEHTVVWRGFGSSWTVSPLAVPAGAQSYLGVACGPTGCAVPLVYGGTSTPVISKITVLTGAPGTDPSTWTEQPVPAPAGAIQSPSGVGCGPADCVIAGQYQRASDHAMIPYLMTGSGTSWSEADAPVPAGDQASAVRLAAVSCAAACVVAGDYEPSAAPAYPAVLLTGDGASFTAATGPTPADAVGYFPQYVSLECPLADRCVAIIRYGTIATIPYNPKEYVLSGWGTDLTATPTPTPDSATDGAPDLGTACAGTACATVGVYRDIWGVTQFGAGVGTLPATTAPWPSRKVAPPARAHGVTAIASIGPAPIAACASATFCAAAGTYTDATGLSRLVLLTGPA